MGVSAQLEQGGGGEHAADLRQAEGGRLPVFVFVFPAATRLPGPHRAGGSSNVLGPKITGLSKTVD